MGKFGRMRPYRQIAASCRRICAILAVGLSLLAAAPAVASLRPPPLAGLGGIGLAGVRFGGDATITRMVLDLDASIVGRVVADESTASRLVIALPTLLSSGPLGGRGQGLVAGWSLRDDGRGARLVLDIAPGARAVRRFLIPPTLQGGRWRYVIDIQSGDPLAVLASADSGGVAARPSQARPVPPPPPPPPPLVIPPPVAAPAMVAVSTPPLAIAAVTAPPTARPTVVTARPSARASTARGRKVIVVDAGHGGHDPGARSLVRNEKDVTLAAALALKRRLEKFGRYTVVLTRDTDVFIPLEERVRIARKAGADLFISLHADSAGSDPTPHGASIYTLSDSGQNRVNYVLGPHEWFANAGGGRSDPGVRQILLDLTQRSTRNRSSQFASLLIGHISNRVDLLPRTHRDAGYFVLLAPDVPAVLLEMGFITNPGDEMRLTDPAQREALMGGVADAIDAYFSGESRLAAG
jgi:N-acetylmuramoyl-L-alanine amidase